MKRVTQGFDIDGVHVKGKFYNEKVKLLKLSLTPGIPKYNVCL